MIMSTTIANRICCWIITLLCTLLLLLAATKIRAEEISHPEEELRMCQCSADAPIAVGHPFVLEDNATVSYLSPSAREVHKQVAPAFSLTCRGPPALS